MSGSLLKRGIHYVKKNGARKLWYKIQERRFLNKQERPYSDWLKNRQPDADELQRQREHVFDVMPKISILVPAYETDPKFLCQMVDSVCVQTYGNWELCIADGSRSDQVKQAIETYMENEPRICYQKLERNLGISENTNGALEIAHGDYVALLDHDDILFPQTLYEVVRAMNEYPDGEAFYTDEDKVSFDLKEHFRPHFKPDFNRELLRSNNYICHFFVVKRSLATEIGGFSSEFDGAQDHDFIFRCTEKAKQVVHIPEILYSWRSHASSTATNPESKLYAYEAGKRAVAAHLKRCGEEAEVLDTANYGFYRVRYKLEKEKFIKSFEIGNGQNGIKVVYYDKACNKIVTFRKEDVTDGYMLFTCVKKETWDKVFLSELISNCQRKDVGIVCARVYDSSRHLMHPVEMAGVNDPFGSSVKGLKDGYLGYFHRACLQQEITHVTDCFMIRGELLARLLHLIKNEEESSFSLDDLARLARKLGYAVVYDPWAVLYEGK